MQPRRSQPGAWRMLLLVAAVIAACAWSGDAKPVRTRGRTVARRLLQRL